MNITSNLSTNHGTLVSILLRESFNEIFWVSPFLTGDFDALFEKDNFSGVDAITLVTTLKKNDQDQITKPESLKSFYQLMHNKCPNAKVRVHIDNSLHGKIFIFKKRDNFKAIVTSANLTRNGLYTNHEWGLLIKDFDTINQLENEVLEGIDYPDVSESLVDRLLAFSKKNLENNPQWSKVAKPYTDILNDVYYQGQNSNAEPKYYLKPVGVSEDPILKEDQKDFSDLHQNLDFSKKGTGAIQAGDIVITTAVGCGCLLSYFQITGSPKEATHDEKKASPWKQRWPWHIEGRNLSVNYGGKWWEHDLDRKLLLDLFLKGHPSEAVTKSGGKTLGTINFGSDKVEITKQFAEFLIEKIKQTDGN